MEAAVPGGARPRRGWATAENDDPPSRSGLGPGALRPARAGAGAAWNPAASPAASPPATPDAVSYGVIAVLAGLSACRLDLTHDGQALCLVACGVATCAAVSAAVQAPHYMRHRTVLAVSIRIMCAWLGNWIIACMHGPVQDMRGWADFGLRRVVTGSLALLALGARLGPAASVLLLLAQAATVLATQRAACGGHLRIHPNYGDFLRPAAAALTAGAAWLVGPYQGPPPAVPTCDAALCWAVVAWTDTALLTLCTAVGLALGGETGVKWGGGRAAAWAGASVFGLAAYWRVLDRAAPAAVPCR